MRVGDLASALVEADFDNLVGNVALDFPSYVHDVQAEDCGGSVNLADVRSV